MKKNLKHYESPAMEVMEIKMQEILCASVALTSVFVFSSLDSYNQDGSNLEGFQW